MNYRFVRFSFYSSNGIIGAELEISMSSRTKASPVLQDTLRWMGATSEDVVQAICGDSRKVFNLLSGHNFYVPTYPFDSNLYATPWVLATRMVMDEISLLDVAFSDDYGQYAQKLSTVENLLNYFSTIKHFGRVR